MYSHVLQLAKIAQQERRLILGVMSGTSLDGLDIALCEIKGHGLDTQLQVKRFDTITYQSDYFDIIKPLFANPDANLREVCSANAWVARKHAELINATLKKWEVSNTKVDLIASHGQTIFHAPAHSSEQNRSLNSTLQIGDGDHIAKLTGCITLSDFRQKHISAGGEGAPMVKYGDYLLFTDKTEYRVLVNLGGVANMSIVPNNASFDEIVSTDTGIANSFLDAMVQRYVTGKRYDKGGHIAATGNIFTPLLEQLLTHPFLALPIPKTTGQEAFSLNWLDAQIAISKAEHLSLADLLASLCEFTAISLCNSIKQAVPVNKTMSVYVSGGGLHNHHLLSRIRAHLPNAIISSIDELGLNGDAKEAALFALLANECICGNSTTFDNNSGIPNVSMGKISFPS